MDYQPMPLSDIAKLVCVQFLLGHHPQSTSAMVLSAMSRLRSHHFTACSHYLLTSIITSCPSCLTNELLEALAPPHLRKISLQGCTGISVTGLRQLLESCSKLEMLELQGCVQLMDKEILKHCRLLAPNLSSISLDCCDTLTNEGVQIILKYFKNLQHLGLSQCNGLTEDVFLLDHTLIHPSTDLEHRYDCRLCSVDLSGCQNITSNTIHHLTSLCGPTLSSVNLACSEAGLFSLLYLSGYSLYAVWDLASKASESLAEVQSLQGMVDKIHLSSDQRNFMETMTEICANNCSLTNGVLGASSSEATDESSVCNPENETRSLGIAFLENLVPTLDFVPEENSRISNSQNPEFSGSSKHDDLSPCAISSSAFHKNPGQESINVCKKSDENPNEPVELNEIALHVDPVPPEVNCSPNSKQMADLISSFTSQNSGTGKNIDKEKGHFFQYQYAPALTSLDITGLTFAGDDSLGKSCLKAVMLSNPRLHKLSMSWKGVDDEVMEYITGYLPGITHLTLENCESITTAGLNSVCSKCAALTQLDLTGVSFISDLAVLPLVQGRDIQSLKLAGTKITDLSLQQLSRYCDQQLQELDISWCDELIGKGILHMADRCVALTSLAIRHCEVTSEGAHLILTNCTKLKNLDLSNIHCLVDAHMVTMATNLKALQNLDVSWNEGLTDAGIVILLRHCHELRELNLAGVKMLTSAPFLLIIADLREFRRVQGALSLQLFERGENDGNESDYTDEEMEDVILPVRSTVYAPNLRFLDLEYVDLVNDVHLQEIVTVCRKTLRIKNYYREEVVPIFLPLRHGRTLGLSNVA